MPHNWINELNASNSRKHKEETIEKAYAAANLGADDAHNFLQCAWFAYNPFLTFNFKRTPETRDYTDRDNPFNEFYDLLRRLANREVTGRAAEVDIEQLSYMFDSDTWNLLLAPTILKDLRVGATIKTFNKILKGTKYEIPVFECQLATDSKKHPKKMSGRKLIEPKLDGVRVLAVVQTGNIPEAHNTGVRLFSRSGKPFENFPQIAQAIQENITMFTHNTPWADASLRDFVLDGEIVSASFQDLMKQAHRKTNVDTSDAVFQIFDVIRMKEFQKGHWNVSQRVRSEKYLAAIRDPINNASLPFKIVKGKKVNLDTAEGREIMERYANSMVVAGYEGIMIKDVDAPYACKRTTTWLKWKPVITVDLEVVALEEGTGRNTGKLGALVCSGVDGGNRIIKTNVGSGLSDENRESIWALGDKVKGFVVEVRADAVTQNQDGTYSLRFPRFVRFRGHKAGEKL